MSSIANDHDVINSLPDTVLCHILSFIPTTEAVATSVLSKRWTHLWRSVPSLNICDVNLDDLEDYCRFNDFVYSVLLARNNTSIKSSIFNIWYDDPHLGRLGFPNVIKWINSIVQRGLERLEMCVGMVEDNLQLPISILSCRTLVVLDVSGFTVKGFSSVRLPSLKILRVQDSIFLNARDLLLLLTGCPILEDLYACNLQSQSEDSLSYQECESLSLSKLIKAQMPHTFCHFPLKALRNVNELCIEINKVYRSFDEIPTFHNLTKSKLHSINYNWNLLVQVLNHCPNLQHIELSQGTDYGGGKRDNDQENWVDPISVPQCISLHLKTCTLWYFRGQQGELQLAKYILNHARVLQTMKICCRDSLKKERELSLCSKVSPTCELIFHVFRFHKEESLSD
ncbi:FBD-associated F-box protein At5g22730-like isoform X1 [Trifolium pratense]|uniref:FBD-associated F-box protein At5g22730-like isoform X1 n=1 Tax=Trifolium pratense TaxID=57577 RepID=UPI001E692E48|nr:FBD-associated F-box protein At5g22730-like isoform X1 [Trifolium pratense]XP_045806872.1 FBD-associated F-box protein At5g22730-like isoform X1 [Trifolium pratense]